MLFQLLQVVEIATTLYNPTRHRKCTQRMKILSTNIGQHSEECMCRLRNIALESVTDGQTDRRTDRRTTDKVIPMCRYASQATQKKDITEGTLTICIEVMYFFHHKYF